MFCEAFGFLMNNLLKASCTYFPCEKIGSFYHPAVRIRVKYTAKIKFCIFAKTKINFRENAQTKIVVSSLTTMTGYLPQRHYINSMQGWHSIALKLLSLTERVRLFF
jgi:hypothetical protein